MSFANIQRCVKFPSKIIADIKKIRLIKILKRRCALIKPSKSFFISIGFSCLILATIYLGFKMVASRYNFVVGEKSTAPSLTITIKTKFENHRTRVQQIIDTWFQFAPNDIYFITDTPDPLFTKTLKDHIINTNCDSTVAAAAAATNPGPSLNCELMAELQLFISKNATWSCRFDDDNYVNVPQLLKVLSTFDPNVPHYLGRIATNKSESLNDKSFYFAKGSAGICLSSAALIRAKEKILNNEFVIYHIKFHELYSDMTLGYMMSAVLGTWLTEMPNFYSNSDDMKAIPIHQLKNIPVLSQKEEGENFVALPHFFDPRDDPYKFHTLQCFLYPEKCTTLFSRLPIHVFDIDKVK